MSLADALLRAMRPAHFLTREQVVERLRVHHPNATALQIDRAFAKLLRQGLAVRRADGMFCR